MTAGVIQLVAYGREDLFLTRDPQITFFKVIYRRHTNFATEEIEQYFIHEPNFGKRTTCKVSSEGDMIDRMTLKITLPEIPRDIGAKFAWIRRIGQAMIKYVEIEINGKVIDKHYGEWLYIWSILTTRNITDRGLDKLIGNVPELTEFTNGKEEYILYVPLYFWFCRASGLSLPLISLQYSDIKVNISLFEFDKCYILSPTHYIKCDANLVNFEQYEYLAQRGNDGIERYGIFSHFDVINKRLYYTAITSDKFIGVPYDGDPLMLSDTIRGSLLNTTKSEKYLIRGATTDFSVKPDLGAKSISSHHKSLKNISLKQCLLLVEYVYLDDDERFKFAQTKQDYLIEQLYFTPNVPIEGTNPKIKLDIDQPCKLTVWLAQLDYISNFNDRFNYTDSHILKKKPDHFHTDPNKIKMFHDKNFNQEVGKSLIDEELIKLNSQVRVERMNNEYFEYVQPFQLTTNTLPPGSGMYSYSLFPTDSSPSGATNMSQIELIEIFLKMNFKVNINQRAKFRSYSLCYNVWRVEYGLSDLIFVK